MRNLAQLKVCFLAGTLEHGGAERQLYFMLRALHQAGAAVRLLSLDRGQFWEEPIKSLGVDVTWVGHGSSRWQRLCRVWKEVRSDPPDVLQSQHFYANAYVGLAARLSGKSGIGALRNNGRSEVQGSGRLGGWLNLCLPTTLAANSAAAIQYAITRGLRASQLFFLPNVVDTEWFRPAAGGSPSQPLTLLAVGRLVKQKRLDRFLLLVHRLRALLGRNIRGLIVGPGCLDDDQRPTLESQAGRLGLLPDAIQFQGGVSDLRPFYHQADVCVLTSDFEGTPNVLLEAMACGLPVVATRVGGVPEIIRHGQTGLLAEPTDLEGLLGALVELAQNPERRAILGSQARAYVEMYHSVSRLRGYLDALYQLAVPPAEPGLASVVQGSSI